MQPIVQGVVTFPGGVGTAPVFTGRGILTIIRDPAAGGQGGYFLALDPGLPGNAGAVPPGTVALPEPITRTMITPRGFGTPPISGIFTISVSYLTDPRIGIGADVIEVVLTNIGLVPTDPVAGFEIIVWEGL
jgi:hypothetical protein